MMGSTQHDGLQTESLIRPILLRSCMFLF